MFDDENSERIVEQEGLETPEEGFMKGYSDDGKVEECVECGSAVEEEEKVVREIDGEALVFCSKACADEFEDSLS